MSKAGSPPILKSFIAPNERCMQAKQRDGQKITELNRDREALGASNQQEGTVTVAVHKYTEPGVPCSFGSRGSPSSLHVANLRGPGWFGHMEGPTALEATAPEVPVLDSLISGSKMALIRVPPPLSTSSSSETSLGDTSRSNLQPHHHHI